MTKPRRNRPAPAAESLLHRLGEEPAGVSPDEEIQEAADLLPHQEPPAPTSGDGGETDPCLIDPAD